MVASSLSGSKTILMSHLSAEQSDLWSAALTAQKFEVISEQADTDIVKLLTQWKQWNSKLPDLLLIDIRLKNLDGNTLQSSSLCRWCRENHPELKVILVNPNQDKIPSSEQRWATRQGAIDMLPRLQQINLASAMARIVEVLGCQLLQEPLQKAATASELSEPASKNIEVPPEAQTETSVNLEDVSSYFERGLERFEQGDKQGALDDMRVCIRINPNYIEAYCTRGDIYFRMGNSSKAMEDYDRAIALKPSYVEGYLRRGIAYYGLGDNQNAIEDFSEAIRLNPKFVKAYCSRGLARFRSGDEQGAFSDYNKAIQIDPNCAEAYNNRGIVRCAIGEVQAAVKDYTQAILMNHEYADAYYNRGNIRSDLGKYQDAVNDYTQAVQINPDFAMAYGNRGLAYYEIDHLNAAIADTQKAADIFFAQGDITKYQQAIDTVKQMQDI